MIFSQYRDDKMVYLKRCGSGWISPRVVSSLRVKVVVDPCKGKVDTWRCPCCTCKSR